MRTLATIPLADLEAARLNPRSDPTADLTELTQSVGTATQPRYAQLPLVQRRPDGHLVLVDGARRVAAAAAAGQTTLEVIVDDAYDPVAAQVLRLVANLHRQDLHPLDYAQGLLLNYLVANAVVLGTDPPAATVLETAPDLAAAIGELQTLLHTAGWNPIRPAVKWQAHLDSLGIALDPSRRRHLLRLLKLDSALMVQLRALPVNEPALRAIAGLPTVTDQHAFITALQADPALARQARHISRMLKLGIYPTLADALAGVRGEVIGVSDAEPDPLPAPGPEWADSALPADPAPSRAGAPRPPRASSASGAPDLDPAMLGAVAQVLALAPQLEAACRQIVGGLAGDPLPPTSWTSYLREVLDPLAEAVTQLHRAVG